MGSDESRFVSLIVRGRVTRQSYQAQFFFLEEGEPKRTRTDACLALNALPLGKTDSLTSTR